ncbi:hypothetical protein [Bacillus sp. 1P06AnD]|uniref:hypothetical protein n=1 Tax=Bacillus sp. 1P06AnD TaxID=3132208 RepID=UPI0039A2E2C7
MKRLSLNDLLKKLDTDSPLSIKAKLLRYKQEGLLFFQGSICNKEWDKPFELYYAETAGKIRYRNAFPITTSDYWKIITHQNPIQLMADYYHEYFNTNKISKRWSGPIYMYRGRQYIWLYVKV